MTDITQDLRVVPIDNEGWTQAVAAAQAYRVGDDPAGFAFTGQATLMLHREMAEWAHDAFSSTPLIQAVDSIQGTEDADASDDPQFLSMLSERVSYMHIPAECQEMQVDDVWGIDCAFLMFAMPDPHDENETVWVLVPGPEGRVVSSRHTVQDYQQAEAQQAQQAQDAQDESGQ